jgi:hypothetical protein
MLLKQNRQNDRYLITQSLLSSWLYIYKSDDGYDDFLKTLHKEPIQPTRAMLEGQRFENCLNSVLNGAEIEPTHEWYKPIMELYPILQSAQQQVALSKQVTVEGTEFVLYGVLDFLKAGVIYDTKFSKSYRVGKYLNSPQHPMYFALVPEAYEFTYLICDGEYIYKETYRPDEVEPIERTIKYFLEFLKNLNLIGIYKENWRSKY